MIGRSFSEPVLRAVAGDGATSRALRTLERAGLIREIAAEPEREYAFHHSLTQDATYGTILLRRRRELHRRVGEVFEELYANRIEEFAPLLAHHFQEGGDDERTLRYATVAGDHAARLYANAEAVTHYDARDRGGARGSAAPTSALGHLYPSRGRALELSGRFDEAVANYEEMEAMAQESGRPGGRARRRPWRSRPCTRRRRRVFDAVADGRSRERTMALARELGDRTAESKALWNLMILNVFGGGDPARPSTPASGRSRSRASWTPREQMAFTLNDLWRPYAAVGDLAASRATLEEARRSGGSSGTSRC